MPEIDPAVRAKVEELVRDVTTPGPTPELSPDGDWVAGIGNAMGKAGGSGPAGETAVRYQHTLLLALPPIWREVYGETIWRRLRQFYLARKVLYGTSAGLPTTSWLDDDEDPAPTDWSELEELLLREEADADATHNELPTIEPEVWHSSDGSSGTIDRDYARKLFPPERWVPLSADDKQYLSNEAARDIGLTWPHREEVYTALMSADEQARLADELWAKLARFRETREAVMTSSADEDDGSRAAIGASFARLRDTIQELWAHVRRPYSFDVFAPRTFNFGVLVTYRQSWTPRNYQVGDLVATIPLAPGETRRISAKRVVRSTRSQRELEESLSTRRAESTTKLRAESEIARRSSLRSNFQHTAEGSFQAEFQGMGGGGRTATSIAVDAGTESNQSKQVMSEATRTAAEEYRAERTVEVTSSSESTLETSSSGEITNPNNEITVTYLLWELERRYTVRTELARITPVVLAAMPIPHWTDIDEDWVIANEWVLRRVLLDDSLRPALEYLTDGLAGDELAVQVLRDQWQTLRRLVTTLEGELQPHLRAQHRARDELARAAAGSGASQGVLEDIAETLFGGEDDAEKAQARVEAAQRALEFINADLEALRTRVVAATDRLERATDELVGALRQQVNRRISVQQLLAHLHDNILYYQQAIWSHEPPDQRYFRMYRWRVPFESISEADVFVADASPFETVSPAAAEAARRAYSGEDDIGRLDASLIVEPGPSGETTVPTFEELELSQVADLDNPLGYKGNYLILPLTRAERLSTLLSLNFVDSYYGVRDPDPASTRSDDRIRDDMELATLTRNREWYDDCLRELTNKLIKEKPDEVEVVVPFDQLYIEALPGTHPILEQFKLAHRGQDVRRAQADSRAAELENLRMAGRLLRGELGDPDVDRVIQVDHGSTLPVVDVDGGP